MKNNKTFKNFMNMNLGCILLSVGVYFFKIPNGFATGGVTGIGTVLGKLSPITPAAWIWILNILLLVLGFLFLGKQNSIKTIYCSMFYSAITYVLERIVPLSAPLTNQPFMELVYAMLLTSVGSAMIFNSDASSGGTDIAALILKKSQISTSEKPCSRLTLWLQQAHSSFSACRWDCSRFSVCLQKN